MTFSSMLNHSNKPESCGIKLREWCGVKTSLPRCNKVPLFFASNPAKRRSRVDLPQPLAHTIETNSPTCKVKSNFCTARIQRFSCAKKKALLKPFASSSTIAHPLCYHFFQNAKAPFFKHNANNTNQSNRNKRHFKVKRPARLYDGIA